MYQWMLLHYKGRAAGGGIGTGDSGGVTVYPSLSLVPHGANSEHLPAVGPAGWTETRGWGLDDKKPGVQAGAGDVRGLQDQVRVGVGHARGWVMGIPRLRRVQRPLGPCRWPPCWKRALVLLQLPDSQGKPEVRVFMGKLPREMQRKKHFSVRGQRWRRLGNPRGRGEGGAAGPPGAGTRCGRRAAASAKANQEGTDCGLRVTRPEVVQGYSRQ